MTLVEDSNTYSTDVAIYRSTFLSKWAGTVATTHPSGGSSCTNPGTNAADGEADLDAEVASAMAPNAAIVVATCKDSRTTNGVLLAVENLVNSATPPTIISQSYGECETLTVRPPTRPSNRRFRPGPGGRVFHIHFFRRCGRLGLRASITGGSSEAFPGIGITGWGETAYNVSVGGTDFEDAYNARKGSPTVPISTYWDTPTPLPMARQSLTFQRFPGMIPVPATC